ncbi:hypothetical protein ANO14919_102810 [Xylariales sp. No.14919]|nr:hypothetical protein ANO14919_102810 [Xylariales sp. No.14919]
MADWSLAAVLIAILAYPLQAVAVPPLLKRIEQACGWLYRRIRPSAQQCTSLEWMTHFKGTSFHIADLRYSACSESDCANPSRVAQRLWSGSWEQALNHLFPNPWRAAVDDRKVPKPHQLSATTQYIRTDREVLLLYAYFSALSKYYGGTQFEDFVELIETNGVLVARMHPTSKTGDVSHLEYKRVCEKLQSCTKSELEPILDSQYSSFPGTLNLHEKPHSPNKEIQHPISSRDDWRRGGWVVAVGMSDVGMDEESPLLRPIIQPDMVESCFRDEKTGKRIILPQHVQEALQRVISTLETFLQQNFTNNSHLQDAVDLTKRFGSNISDYLKKHSLLRINLEKSSLFRDVRYSNVWPHNPGQLDSLWGTGEMLRAHNEDCDFIISLFNEHRQLTGEERDKLEPMLRDVCRAALVGMIRVFHFYEYRRIIVEPALLWNFRLRHIYLEDSPQ